VCSINSRAQRPPLAQQIVANGLPERICCSKGRRAAATRPCAVPVMTAKEQLPGHTVQRLDCSQPLMGAVNGNANKLDQGFAARVSASGRL